MTNVVLTPGELTARLVVEFCLPLIQGTVKGRTPVGGRALSGAEREELGITERGVTFAFSTEPTGVLLDLTGPEAKLWFQEADCETSLAPFETALKRAYPNAKQLEDTPHPSGRATRTRAYRVELGGSKLCTIEVGYPVPNATKEDRLFVVRVKALVRHNGGGRIARAAQPAEKKKKGWF